jgi:hypothetical protein
VGLPYLYDDLWVMHTVGQSSLPQLPNIMFSDQVEWTEVKPVGAFIPASRYGHSATYCDNKVLFFGGFDGNRFLNDFLALERNGNGNAYINAFPIIQILSGFVSRRVEYHQLLEQGIQRISLLTKENYSFLEEKMN